jgi:hypothetical protein
VDGAGCVAQTLRILKLEPAKALICQPTLPHSNPSALLKSVSITQIRQHYSNPSALLKSVSITQICQLYSKSVSSVPESPAVAAYAIASTLDHQVRRVSAAVTSSKSERAFFKPVRMLLATRN